MDLDQLWSDFTGRMGELQLLHSTAKSSVDEDLRRLHEYAEAMESDQRDTNEASSVHNLAFKNAKTGDFEFYMQARRTIEERSLHAHLHKNKQYQWLLAEAYEEFEDFIEKAYAFYGLQNRSFWPLRDYGNITFSELGEKSFDWYAEQAKKKKGAPHSILNRFRSQFPELCTIEIDNKFEINLSFAIALIEKMRHIIVHKGGVVTDKEAFINSVFNQAGLSTSGQDGRHYVNFINRFFGLGEHQNLIVILEVPTNPEIPLDFHINVFRKLTNYLMAYAHLIYECIGTGPGATKTP